MALAYLPGVEDIYYKILIKSLSYTELTTDEKFSSRARYPSKCRAPEEQLKRIPTLAVSVALFGYFVSKDGRK